MKYLFLLAVLVLALFSCKSQKPIVLGEYDGPKLSFGSGGGFSGKYVSHSILPSGEVFVSKDGSKSFNPTRGIDKNVALQMIQNFESLGFTEMKHDDPGNMTYFVKYENKGKSYHLKWGGEQIPAPKKLKSYYRTLSMLVKDSQAATK